MQRQPIHLRFYRADYMRMTVAQRENPEPAETVDEFTPMKVAQHTTFALPLDDRAFDHTGIGPAIEIGIEILDALANDLRFLILGRFVIDTWFHSLVVKRM